MMVERIKHVANAGYLDEMSKWPPTTHPVVRVHPESGRKGINVNANWTSHIVELSTAESDQILALLYQHIKSPEFQVRFHWEEGSVAVWDNRAVQHYAVADYTERRVMQRVTIVGDRPEGPMSQA
jgi:taurine dioxygenase